jgi:hypothetical protein
MEALGLRGEARLRAALVEAKVRDLQEEVGAASVVRIGRHAVVEVECRAAAGPQGEGADPAAHALDDGDRGDHVGVGKDEHELVAAPAAAGVDRAQGLADDARGPDEDAVADGMAQAVVDRLEAAEVHHHGRDDALGALGAGDLAPDVIEQEAPVVEPGQRIGDRVHPQHREVGLRDEAGLLQNSLPAVQVMEEDGLESQRRAQPLAQLGQELFDLVPALRGVLGLERETRPVGEQLAEDLGAVSVGDGRERLLEARQRKIPLTTDTREAPDVCGHVVRCQVHPPLAALSRSAARPPLSEGVASVGRVPPAAATPRTVRPRVRSLRVARVEEPGDRAGGFRHGVTE